MVDNETTCCEQEGPTLSIETMRRLMDQMPVAPRNPLLGNYGNLYGMPVIEIPQPQQVVVGYETKRFEGHPFVKWLARVLPAWATFEPDILIEVPIYGPAPFAYRFGNTMLMSREHSALLRCAVTAC